jgi:phage terminase large subunit-like protein
VVELCVDPALWQADLESLLDSGFPVVEFTQRGQRMFDATQRAFELATTQGLRHDGNLDLARHVGNAVVKVDSRGPRLVKVHERSTQHIDLAVAMVMALQRAYEIELEAEYATVLFAKDFVQQVDETAQARGPRMPKLITQADYTVPNQFNIGPPRRR